MDCTDSHSYLAWGKLQSRREKGGLITKMGPDSSGNDAASSSTSNEAQNARSIFETGTKYCPQSIHLWHAWAMHEQTLGNIDKARELLDKALELDRWNGYVCHSFGLLETQCGDWKVGWLAVVLFYCRDINFCAHFPIMLWHTHTHSLNIKREQGSCGNKASPRTHQQHLYVL